MKKKITIVFGILIIALVAGYFIGKPILEKIILEKAESSLEDSYGAQVDIGSVTLHPFKQQVEIDGVEFTHPYKPEVNAIYVGKSSFTFDLKKWFQEKTIFLSYGELLGVSVEEARKNGKGRVNREEYPIIKNSIPDLSKIDINALTKDFTKNLDENLKKSSLYQKFEADKKKYDSLINGSYKEQLTDIKKEIQELKGIKITKDNLAINLEKVKKLQAQVSNLESIQNDIKGLKADVYSFKDNISKLEGELIDNFIAQAGLGDFSTQIKSSIQSFFSKDSKNVSSQISETKKTVSQTSPKTRDDILFFVQKIDIKGKDPKTVGKIQNLNNKKGEDFKDWEGITELKLATPKNEGMDFAAKGANGQWSFKGDISRLLLNNFNFIEGLDIASGYFNLASEGVFGRKTNVKGLFTLKLDELKANLLKDGVDNKWNNMLITALTKNPITANFTGNGIGIGDIQWDVFWKNSLKELANPLTAELKAKLKGQAKSKVEGLFPVPISLDSLDELKKDLDTLKKDFVKKNATKLLDKFIKF